ncbi:MAG TPA: MarR family winged helix-turn-helix transcriptional regulator [Candidatus Sulfotelmatobacter sp.]|nr:MarR family winged helix-turn-helix transcriptional regulator [Candidatus Sulfotelmatobacter sp.]
MATAAGIDGDGSMIAVDRKTIPDEILKDSVLVHLAAAYFSVSKQLERRTGCSQTRGFILSTLRGGAERNQNQIATLLGFDRTVVHRSIGTMLKEGLVSKKKAGTGRTFVIRLTPKGEKYREFLIKERRAAEEGLRRILSAEERAALIRLLGVVAEFEI